jgi:hypothetical protein
MATILSAQQKLWNIKVLMVLVPQVCYHNSLRIRRYLLWAALIPPSLSPGRAIICHPCCIVPDTTTMLVLVSSVVREAPVRHEHGTTRCDGVK